MRPDPSSPRALPRLAAFALLAAPTAAQVETIGSGCTTDSGLAPTPSLSSAFPVRWEDLRPHPRADQGGGGGAGGNGGAGGDGGPS